MPLLHKPLELRSTPSLATRVLRTTGLVIAAVGLFLLGLSILVLAST